MLTCSKRLIPQEIKGEKFIYWQIIWGLLILLEYKQGKEGERERAGRREAEKLYGRRSAHLSLSLCKVKARVEITEFGSLKTSRTHTHTHTSCGLQRWGARGSLSEGRIQRTENVVSAAADRNAGMAWHMTPCSHRREKHPQRMYADKL